MGTEIIQAQYDQLEQIASRFAQQAEASAELHRRVQQASQVLEGGDWQGRGIDAFSAEMNDVPLPSHDAICRTCRVSRFF